MKVIILVALHLILLDIGDSSVIQVLKPNVVALQVKNNVMAQKTQVPLRCGDQYEEKDVHWQKNGRNIPAKGNSINVTIEAMLGGNFTCHSETNELLNHTLVLVMPVDFDKAILARTHNKEFITCSAINYNGAFHCSWTWNPIRNGAVLFYQVLRNSSHINCTLDSDYLGLTCKEQHCPHSEEVSRISLTLLVQSNYRVEEHSKTFFINDIVKPENVIITKTEDDEIEWEPPKTWNIPCSYYPLEYEVKAVFHRKGCDQPTNRAEFHHTTETHFKVISKKSYTFCVRARDNLTNQVWSDWSHTNVTKQPSKKLKI